MLGGIKDWVNDRWDSLNEDIVRGATPEIRNKQREKVADFLFDIAKFMVTGLAFGFILTSAVQLQLNIVAVSFIGLCALLAGAFFAWGGLRELSKMERPTP